MDNESSIKLSRPTDLLSIIPPNLGFVPEHSLVIIGLDQSRVHCTFRVDLPGGIDRLDDLPALTGQVARNRCDAVILVTYGEFDLARAALERARADFEASGIEVFDALAVAEGRWYRPDSTDPSCPPEGLPLPETTAAATAMIVAGAQQCPDRDAVAALLEPAAEEQRAAVAAAVEAALLAQADQKQSFDQQRAADLRAVDDLFEAEKLPGPEAIAAITLGLADLEVRDYALRRSDLRRTAPLPSGDVWLWITRHVEDDLLAAPATIAGWCAYRSGNGVLANQCFLRALDASPSYRLAGMLMAALQSGIPPRALDGICNGGGAGSVGSNA